MPPKKGRKRKASSAAAFASPPAKKGSGRVSARLQSLYTGPAVSDDAHVDVVRACRPFKARAWRLAPVTIGGDGPQAFTVRRWRPQGPASEALRAVRDRPPARAGTDRRVRFASRRKAVTFCYPAGRRRR